MSSAKSVLFRVRPNYINSLLVLTGITLSCIPATPAWAQAAPKTPVASAATAPSSAVPTKRVLVQPMQVTAAVDRNAEGLGSIVADMLTTALMQRGVRVVERQQLGALEKEKNLGPGITDTRSTQRTGKIKGAAVAVIGTITEFGLRENRRGFIGTIGAVTGANVKEAELRIKIDAHLTDIATGDLIPGSQVSVEGKQKDVNWTGGAGTLFKGIPLGGIASGGTNEWLESKAGKAARKVVEQIADQIAAKVPKAAAGADEEETISVVASGFAGFAAVEEFTEAVKALPGVVSAEQEDYADGVLTLSVVALAQTLKRLPVLLETDAQLKPMRFMVSSLNKQRIVLKKKQP